MKWVKPSSIIIEIFPVGFCIPNYFDGLSSVVNIIKYPHQVSFHDAVKHKLLHVRPICKQYYEKLFNNTYNTVNCIDNSGCRSCRSCTRGADGIIVKTTIIQSIVYYMIIQRKICMN